MLKSIQVYFAVCLSAYSELWKKTPAVLHADRQGAYMELKI